jgi:GTP cyclohydrolase II
MTVKTAPAAIRAQVTVPVRLANGYRTEAIVHTFRGLVDGAEHLLLSFRGADAESSATRAPLVRLHSECLTGDVFGSERCDCGPQLDEAIMRLDVEGGYLLYLRQEGRGIGLYSKLDAYELQDAGLDTYEANRALGHGDDDRDYSAAAQMLHAVDATHIRLLSNNPDKRVQLVGHGITVEEMVSTGVHLTQANARYLRAKRDHTGHAIALPAAS